MELRRATTMETPCIQADYLREFKQARQALSASREAVYAMLGQASAIDNRGSSIARCREGIA
jgi:hypothetical protein